MEDLCFKARQGRLAALARVRAGRLNMFAGRRPEGRSNVHSVIAQLSDIRVRMGAQRMALSALPSCFGGALRLR